MENAKVALKKTKNFVLSDSLGRFSIECDVKDKISIKAAGLKQSGLKLKV